MKYDDFKSRLRELKEEFTAVYGREPLTMAEFEVFLDRKKAGKTKVVSLKSLKGFSF